MRRIVTINFPEEDESLYKHLVSKKNISRYIRDLIRRDIEGWELKSIIQELLRDNSFKVNQNISQVNNFKNMKGNFEKLINLKRED